MSEHKLPNKDRKAVAIGVEVEGIVIPKYLDTDIRETLPVAQEKYPELDGKRMFMAFLLHFGLASLKKQWEEEARQGRLILTPEEVQAQVEHMRRRR